ncbi:unnamed protein product [Aspergillus oryzae]|nr:unnamed protein product [Aspergillus oryzae]GMF95483.1 unnamed protein product [Aspergillus oryzae]
MLGINGRKRIILPSTGLREKLGCLRKYWTRAGAIAGMDMVACWLKDQFGEEILTYAVRNLDYEPRGVDGVSLVIPRRYDESGKQISTHEFFYY